MGNSDIKESKEMNAEETKGVKAEHPQDITSTDTILTDEANDRKKRVKNTDRIVVLLKTIISLLKKNARKITIATIVGIIGIVIGIMQLWPKSVVDISRDEINQKATIIKTTFNPNAIQIDSLSSPDYQMVKGFQLTALRMVDKWNEINSMEPLADFCTTDLNIMMNIIASRLDVINNFDKEVANIQSNVTNILEYGKANNISQYTPSYEKTALLYEKTGKRDNLFGQAKESMMSNVMNLMLSYSGDLKNVPKDKVVKAVAPLDELYNNKEVLDYINTLFTWVIELNTSYMDYFNYSNRSNAQ